jgi:plasmid stabilization system protein ParE
MAYLVELSDRAKYDLETLYVEKNFAASRAAARWFNGLEEAVDALDMHPHRCPFAPESQRLGRKVRHLLYGKKSSRLSSYL